MAQAQVPAYSTGPLDRAFDVLGSMRSRARSSATKDAPRSSRPSRAASSDTELIKGFPFPNTSALGASLGASPGLLGQTDHFLGSTERGPNRAPAAQSHAPLAFAAAGPGAATVTPSNGPSPFGATAVSSAWCAGSVSPPQRLSCARQADPSVVAECAHGGATPAAGPPASNGPKGLPAGTGRHQLSWPTPADGALAGRSPQNSLQPALQQLHGLCGGQQQQSGPTGQPVTHPPATYASLAVQQTGGRSQVERLRQGQQGLATASGQCSADAQAEQQQGKAVNLLSLYKQEWQQGGVASRQQQPSLPVPSAASRQAVPSPLESTPSRPSIVPALAAQLEQHPQVCPLDVALQYRQAVEQQHHLRRPAGLEPSAVGSQLQATQAGSQQLVTSLQHLASPLRGPLGQLERQHQGPTRQAPPAHGQQHSDRQVLIAQPQHLERSPLELPQQCPMPQPSCNHRQPRPAALELVCQHHQPALPSNVAQPISAPDAVQARSSAAGQLHAPLNVGQRCHSVADLTPLLDSQPPDTGQRWGGGGAAAAPQQPAAQYSASDPHAPPSSRAQHSLPAYPATASTAAAASSPASTARVVPHSSQQLPRAWAQHPQSAHNGSAPVGSVSAHGPATRQEATAVALRLRQGPPSAHDRPDWQADPSPVLCTEQQQHQMSGQDSCATPDEAAQEEVEARTCAGVTAPSSSKAPVPPLHQLQGHARRAGVPLQRSERRQPDACPPPPQLLYAQQQQLILMQDSQVWLHPSWEQQSQQHEVVRHQQEQQWHQQEQLRQLREQQEQQRQQQEQQQQRQQQEQQQQRQQQEQQQRQQQQEQLRQRQEQEQLRQRQEQLRQRQEQEQLRQQQEQMRRQQEQEQLRQRQEQEQMRQRFEQEQLRRQQEQLRRQQEQLRRQQEQLRRQQEQMRQQQQQAWQQQAQQQLEQMRQQQAQHPKLQAGPGGPHWYQPDQQGQQRQWVLLQLAPQGAVHHVQQHVQQGQEQQAQQLPQHWQQPQPQQQPGMQQLQQQQQHQQQPVHEYQLRRIPPEDLLFNRPLLPLFKPKVEPQQQPAGIYQGSSHLSGPQRLQGGAPFQSSTGQEAAPFAGPRAHVAQQAPHAQQDRLQLSPSKQLQLPAPPPLQMTVNQASASAGHLLGAASMHYWPSVLSQQQPHPLPAHWLSMQGFPSAEGQAAQDPGSGMRQLSLVQVKAEVLGYGSTAGAAGQPGLPVPQHLQQQCLRQQQQLPEGPAHFQIGTSVAVGPLPSVQSSPLKRAAAVQQAVGPACQFAAADPTRSAAAPPPSKRRRRADGRPPLPPAPQRDAANGVPQLNLDDPGAAAAAAAIQAVDRLLAMARAPTQPWWQQQQPSPVGNCGRRVSNESGSETGSESAPASGSVAPGQGLGRYPEPARRRRTSQQGGRRGQAAPAAGKACHQATPEGSVDADVADKQEEQQPDPEEGCARSRPINLSRIGQHRHKPPPVLRPIRPGGRLGPGVVSNCVLPGSLPAPAADVADGCADDSDDEIAVLLRRGARGPRDEDADEDDGAAAPRRRSKRPIKVPAALAPPSPPAALRLPRNGRLGAETTRALLASLREAKALLNSRFVVRRSKIAQLGVFATANIPADALLMEYYGESVRSSVADLREKRYNAAGLGCYLFNPGGPADEAVVLDATHMGNIMRFVNHSCSPNCVARTVVVEGRRRIFLFSNTELHPGTELTYDYKLSSDLCLDMFKGLPEEMIEQAAEEAGVELLLCQCGSRRCRKYL